MPCNIDYDGLAPVQMYFRPETVILGGQDDDDDGQLRVVAVEQEEEQKNEDEKESSTATTIHAASFRGRGLMAGQKRKLPESIMGTVLLPPGGSGSNSQTKLRMGEVFHDVLEWEHEWNDQELNHAKKVGSDGDNKVDVNDVNSESSVEKALALIELLRSVHDPLPLED